MDIVKLASHFLKLAVRENLILKNRIKLIRAMINAAENIKNVDERILIKKVINLIRQDEWQHFLSISLTDPQIVSYSKNENTKNNDQKRTKTTLGKYLQRNFKYEKGKSLLSIVKEKTINQFVNNVLSNIATVSELEKNINILDEEKITDYYSQSDELSSSCMTGEDSIYVELYSLNPNKVKLVTLGDRARALLWTADDGTKILDRAYPAQSKEIVLLRQWAKLQGYVLRRNPDQLVEHGDVELSDNRQHIITLKYNEYFPYMDTFKFGKFIDGNTLQVSNYETFGNLKFNETDGTYKSISCDNCDSIKGPFKHVGRNTYCQSCFDEYYTMCVRCKETISINNAISDDEHYYCNVCFYEIYSLCERCGETMGKDEAIPINKDLEYWCENCAEKNAIECDSCEEYYTLNKLHKVYNENNQTKFVCSDCYEKNNIEICIGCHQFYDYNLKMRRCKNCKPELYTTQYKLPFSEKEIKFNETLKNLEAKYNIS